MISQVKISGDRESIEILKESQALLEGHFLLSSGLHSPVYIQTALALQFPEKASLLGEKLGALIKSVFTKNTLPDLIVSPAIGGIIIGQEVARAVGVRHIFFEKYQGEMKLRRNFRVNAGERALVVEDVITTGASSKRIINRLESSGVEVIGVAAIVERSSPQKVLSHRVLSLVKVEAPTYSPEECPMCAAGSNPLKMGSSWV